MPTPFIPLTHSIGHFALLIETPIHAHPIHLADLPQQTPDRLLTPQR